MKFLITGGTGFIGTWFVRELRSAGHDLSLLDLYPPEDTTRMFADIPFVRGDVRDAAALAKAMQGCDRVLHLAAAHHDFGIEKSTFDSVNVEAARVICQVMDQHNIKDVCFYSTVAVYGKAKPPIDENTPGKPESPYGKQNCR